MLFLRLRYLTIQMHSVKKVHLIFIKDEKNYYICAVYIVYVSIIWIESLQYESLCCH